LHVLPTLEVGGMENGVVNVVNGLDERFNSSIFCLDDLGALSSRVKREKVNVRSFNKPPGKAPLLIYTLAKLFKSGDFDVVHTHNKLTLEYAVPAALLAGVPLVVHGIHGASPTPGPIRRSIYQFLYARFDAVMLVSEALRDDVTNKWAVNDNKIHTIINGVDSELFCPKDKVQGLAKKHGISGDEFILGSVGRLSSVKNYSILIDLVAKLRDKGNNVKGLIVGNGPELDKLTSHINDKGLKDSFILVGESNEIPDYLAIMDLFILPSLSEGMSNSILEAMSCGKAIVATRVGGNPELVKDEVNGILVTPDNLDSLLQATELLMNNANIREQMGEESRRIIENKYSLKCMVENYANFYIKMLDNKTMT